MPFMSILGKRFRHTGLIESGVVAAGSIHQVMEEKHYNRSMYAHKLMFKTTSVTLGFLNRNIN